MNPDLKEVVASIQVLRSLGGWAAAKWFRYENASERSLGAGCTSDWLMRPGLTVSAYNQHLNVQTILPWGQPPRSYYFPGKLGHPNSKIFMTWVCYREFHVHCKSVLISRPQLGCRCVCHAELEEWVSDEQA